MRGPSPRDCPASDPNIPLSAVDQLVANHLHFEKNSQSFQRLSLECRLWSWVRTTLGQPSLSQPWPQSTPARKAEAA